MHARVTRSTGLVDLEELDAAITPETAIVTVMAVNNEIGTTQPIAEIGALCRKHKTFFHTDAAQAVGKVCFCRCYSLFVRWILLCCTSFFLPARATEYINMTVFDHSMDARQHAI